MFKGNVLDNFLRLKKVDVIPFTEVQPTQIDKHRIRNLIDLKPLDRKLLKLGMSVYAYSKMDKKGFDLISNYIRSTGLSVGAKAKDTMYTFPKDVSPVEMKSGKRVAPRGFLTYKTDLVDDDGNVLLDSMERSQKRLVLTAQITL